MAADLYVPTDVDEAHEAWGANCGPCALAAMLGRQVNAVRELFEPWPGYTNPTLIKRAVERAGRRWVLSWEKAVQAGLGFIQFQGPWEKGGPRAEYRHTHWVALARRPWCGGGPVLMVYDAAAGEAGGWVQIGAFSGLVMPLYLERMPKATGWHFRLILEVKS